MEYKKLTEMLNGKRIVIIGENIDDGPAVEAHEGLGKSNRRSKRKTKQVWLASE